LIFYEARKDQIGGLVLVLTVKSSSWTDDSLAVRGLINYGKGGTEVEFQIDPASFGELARAMMAIDKNAAVKAFGAALSDGIE